MRAATDADLPALVEFILGAFLRDPEDDELEVQRLIAEPDRTEISIVDVHVGDTVTVEIDALPDVQLQGTVTSIKPLGTNVEGEDVRKTVAVQLTKPGEGRARIAEAGLGISAVGDDVRVTSVKFGSRAKKSGFEQGFKVAAIKLPNDRPSEHWVYIPGLALVAFVYFLQRARLRSRRAGRA